MLLDKHAVPLTLSLGDGGVGKVEGVFPHHGARANRGVEEKQARQPAQKSRHFSR